jgi:hypothetical protein
MRTDSIWILLGLAVNFVSKEVWSKSFPGGDIRRNEVNNMVHQQQTGSKEADPTATSFERHYEPGTVV